MARSAPHVLKQFGFSVCGLTQDSDDTLPSVTSQRTGGGNTAPSVTSQRTGGGNTAPSSQPGPLLPAGVDTDPAGAAPEDIWTPFIQQYYPHLLSQTYCLPPIFFYRTPQTVATIAGQTVLVRDNPSASGTGQQQPAPPPAQVAGRVFVENPSDSQDVRTQESDWQGDIAHDRCLQALSGMQNEVMFIISSLRFQHYLHNPANPLHAAAIAKLTSIDDPSIPQNVRNGECDLIIIHRTYGLLIGEIKSVGGNDYFRKLTPGEQTQTIIKQIQNAVKQLENQHIALSHLVRDLPSIRISMTLLLPNVSSSQLQSALSASPSLLQGLDVRHCLCQENLAQLLTWWQTLNTSPDQSMTDDLYRRLVARLVEAQLRSMEPAAAANIQRLCYVFSDDGFSAGAAVARLQWHIRPGPVLVIFDEADCRGYRVDDRYVAFLTEIRDQLPAVSVWGAGVHTLEERLSDPVPSWLKVRSLQEALRCPPSVTAVLGETVDIRHNLVLPYSAPRHPEATHGPPVHWRQHRDQPGHSDGRHPEECDVCSDDVFKFLTMELRVGQTGMLTVVISVWTGEALQYRDVIILCYDVPRADVAMVQRLLQRGVPVRVTSYPPSPDDEEELALAATDVVMVTHWRSVRGLERRVVVALGPGGSVWNLEPLSRCSGCLYNIDCKDPW
ncbi:hypothetical protein ACOMHN_016789 [Nucella lapillus]